jgi:HEAT repeat protein
VHIMNARRILIVGFCLVVLVLLLLPNLSYQWRRYGNANSFRNEPVYNGKPLHEWAMDTQDEAITGGPSPLALEANQALQAIGPAAIPWLIKWIKPPVTDSRMPGGAVYALKALGSQATSAIPELVKILDKPVMSLDDQSSQISAAEALSYLGPEAIPFMLTAATNHLDPEIQSELIQNFGNLGTNGVAAIPALITWAGDKNASIRMGAMIALGRIAMEPATVIPVLRNALKDSDGLVRSYAGESLGNFGNAAKATVPELIKALDDPNRDTQTGAIEALGQIGEQREMVLPLLLKKLHDNDWIVRRVTAYALGNLGGQQAFDALMQSTDDPEGFVREAVFESLKKIDPQQLEKSGKKFYGSGQPRPAQN